MATLAQITANRLNAQKSTGPRSAEGKAVSCFNALKHAASAKSLVIPGEDESALAELAAAYHGQFQPVGPQESLLVEKIVAADWAQRRMRCLEAQVFNSLIAQLDESTGNPIGAAFLRDCEGPNALQKIFRRREAAGREWYRALNELRELQARRYELPPPPPAVCSRPPAPQPESPSANQPLARALPPYPSEDRLPSTPTGLQPPTRKIGFVLDETTPPAWRL